MSETEPGRMAAQERWNALSGPQRATLQAIVAMGPQAGDPEGLVELTEQGLLSCGHATARGVFVALVGTSPRPSHPCHVNPMGYIAWHAKARRNTRNGICQEACRICNRLKYPDEECAERLAQRAGGGTATEDAR